MPELIQVDKLCNQIYGQNDNEESIIWEPNMNPANHSSLVKEIQEEDLDTLEYFANLSTEVINQFQIDTKNVVIKKETQNAYKKAYFKSQSNLKYNFKFMGR